MPPPKEWQTHSHLKDLPFSHIEAEVGLLLGQADSSLLRTLETITGQENEPYAARYTLGWALQGVSDSQNKCLTSSIEENLSSSSEIQTDLKVDLEALYRAEFEDPLPGVKGNSQEDCLWEQRVKSNMSRIGGKLQIDLPFKTLQPSMPNNINQSFSCAMQLKRRLLRDSILLGDYSDFMEKMVSNGHLEVIPPNELVGRPGGVWYLVHHPVYHKAKGKLRVVFDCSREYRGFSLNKMLLQGPDLLNNLVGVLLRFRQYPVAFSGDIEQMFLQLKVPSEHSDYMRLFWWKNGNLSGKPIQYRLTSHTFGAVSSPSVANFAVKQAACFANQYSDAAKDALAHGAYMDDVLCSAPSVEEACETLQIVRHAAEFVGFNLRGVVSNSRQFLLSVPAEALSANYVNLDVGVDELPRDRVLGVGWLVDEDCFTFSWRLPVLSQHTTKRSLLSSLGSIFDPLGLVLPIIVPLRSLFQKVCSGGVGWDDPLPADAETVWRDWLGNVQFLRNLKVSRCILGESSANEAIELHIFADGSEVAFAACAYSRYRTLNGNFKCALLMAKARQVPISRGAYTSIPRIELAAAKLAVVLGVQVAQQLTINIKNTYYWSDSLTVLHYIRNTSAKFQRFVTNRVDFILEHSVAADWHFVKGKHNVADLGSRGCAAHKLLNRVEWFEGPHFLYDSDLPYFEEPDASQVYLEVKQKVLAVNTHERLGDPTSALVLDSTSSWIRMMTRVYVFQAFAVFLKSKICMSYPMSGALKEQVKISIWKFVQDRSYSAQLRTLKRSEYLKKSDKIFKCNPVIIDGLMCVNSRVRTDYCGEGSSYPVILPGDDHVVVTFIRYVHQYNKH